MGETRPRPSLRVRAAVASAMLVALVAASAAVTPAAAAGAGAGARDVRVGAAPRLPRDAEVLGALPSTAVLHVEVALQPRDPAALRSFAVAVSTPGSPLYRLYLPRGAFADRFGPTAAAVAAVERSLRAAGLRPGAPSADRLLIPLTATAGALARAFGTGFERVRIAGRVAYTNTAAPLVPAGVKQYVQAVIGLDDLVVPHPMLVPAKRPAAAHPAVRRATAAGPAPCSQAAALATSTGPYTTDQLARVYGFSGLYSAGDTGSGVTIGVAELEPFSQGDLAWWESCYSVSTKVAVVPVDGGADTAQSGEAALDLEDVVGLAPGASVRLYEGPNNPSNGDDGFQSLIDIYDRMVAADDDRVITTSWGACESDVYYYDSSIFGSESTIFQEAASQGESVFAAAGDAGSEGCYPSDGSTGLGVDDPASQWWGVTGVGGTTLPNLTTPADQAVWNDHSTYGGGGGTSGWWTSMPSYQSGAAASLGVDNGTYSDGAREVPDVSSDADPSTGLVYYYQGALGVTGGTSLGAPLWAAMTALVDSYGSCASAPVGFANPVLYSAAGADYAGTFTDVKSGENDVAGTNSGWYPAYAGYDMASGLGTPNAFGLASYLCATAPAAPSGLSVAAGAVTTPGDGQASLSWTAPFDGGAPITGYTVSATPSCPACHGLGTVAGTATSRAVSGLAPGTAYTFGVSAINGIGTGKPAGSVPVTFYTVPSAPAAVTPALSGAGVKVSVRPPAQDGGEAVTAYVVTPSPACPACHGTTTASTSTVVTGLTPGVAYRFTAKAVNHAGAGPASAASAAVLFPLPDGYWLAARDGAVFALGAAPSLSGTRATAADPVVGITNTPDGKGIFLTTANGTVTASGGARFHGDLPAERVVRDDIVSIVSTQDGGGYWLVGADGEVYPFGDAPFHGDLLSLPKPVLVSDVVGMVACAGDAGYLLIGSDGGVFAFGKTHFYGSLPGIGVKVHDIRAILPSATDTGYVLVGADGGAFVFGTGTRFFGSLPGRGIKVGDIVGLAITRDGGGYYMAGADGTVYGFGDARVYPTPAGVRSNLPVAAIAGV